MRTIGEGLKTTRMRRSPWRPATAGMGARAANWVVLGRGGTRPTSSWYRGTRFATCTVFFLNSENRPRFGSRLAIFCSRPPPASFSPNAVWPGWGGTGGAVRGRRDGRARASILGRLSVVFRPRPAASLPYFCRTCAASARIRLVSNWFYWRPLPDSNRCCRRERAVSWASRRRGRGSAG
jgi:hypothetical protein